MRLYSVGSCLYPIPSELHYSFVKEERQLRTIGEHCEKYDQVERNIAFWIRSVTVQQLGLWSE